MQKDCEERSPEEWRKAYTKGSTLGVVNMGLDIKASKGRSERIVTLTCEELGSMAEKARLAADNASTSPDEAKRLALEIEGALLAKLPV